jgi:hypothetical protein
LNDSEDVTSVDLLTIWLKDLSTVAVLSAGETVSFAAQWVLFALIFALQLTLLLPEPHRGVVKLS